MMNVLQLIVRVPLFSVAFPANAQTLFGILIEITNFSFFSIKSVENFLFKFTPTSPYNENFNSLGYTTTNSIQNAAGMFYYLAIIILIYLVLVLIKYLIIIFKINEKSESK
jgi:hypothetical protein